MKKFDVDYFWDIEFANLYQFYMILQDEDSDFASFEDYKDHIMKFSRGAVDPVFVDKYAKSLYDRETGKRLRLC